jgi:hypothetical protein
VPDVGLVEVVDVEDEDAGGVHVGPVVLGVEVALDPDAGRALVDPRVVEAGHVVVEEAGRAPVEGERVASHLAELAAEGGGVGVDQVGEGIDQHLDDPAAPGVGVGGQVGQGVGGGVDGHRCPFRSWDAPSGSVVAGHR